MRLPVLLGALCLGAVVIARADMDVDTRVEVLNEEIAARPADPYLFIQRGLSHSNNNRPLAALRDIQTAETLGPPVDAAFARGILHYRAGEFVSARSALDNYLESFPQDTAARIYRFRLLRDMADYADALDDYHQLHAMQAQLNPGHHIAAAQMMAEVYSPAAAVALLDARMDESGAVTPLQRKAIALERERGNHKAALQRLGDLDEQLRATPEWHLDVARELVALDQPDAALMHLNIAQEQLLAVRRTVAREQVGREVAALHQSLAENPPAAMHY